MSSPLPFLPADEFFEEAHFPWFAQVEARTDAIREEMLALLADPGLGRRLNALCLPYSLSSALDFRLAGLKALGSRYVALLRQAFA